jgi:glycosyltransferase involved in cell wall biosynthesis
VIVAIPARDEARSIRECIRSVDRAAAEVTVQVFVVVAADSCSDDTLSVARATVTEFCEVVVIEGVWGRAGAARAAAVQHALDHLPQENGPIWIANTDADCVVPTQWLRIQLELATEVDAVAGIVELDPDTTAPMMFEAFSASYVLDGDEHGHVHGANIGMCIGAYLAAGGWCRNTVVGEDHVIWGALQGLGHHVRQTTRLRVRTSARTRSRVVGGFATNLNSLDSQPSIRIAANV